jgi:hypothetical protein
MLEELDELVHSARRLVGDLDPERITPWQADRLLDAFVALERAAVAGKLLCAAKAADSCAWRQEGHRHAADWLADTMGIGLGPAIATLATAEWLAELPVLADALRRGELSQSQAEVIANSAAVAPDAEEALVEAAGRQSLTGLRAEARRLEAAAGLDDAARIEAVRKSRYLRHWRDADGAFRISCRMTEDTAWRILEAVNAGVNEVWEEALVQHRQCDATEAYRLDALERLVVRGDRCTSRHDAEHAAHRARRSPTVHLRVDATALRRGVVEPGDICEVPGIGPVSLSTARSILADSVVKVLVTDGVDVAAVAHVGRTIPRALATALAERDPVCVVTRCEQADGLEIDHYQVAWADGGPSELWNLARLCRHHHRLKTYAGFTLSGGPGHWVFTGPDGVEWTEFLDSTCGDGDPRDPRDQCGREPWSAVAGAPEFEDTG